MDLETFKQILAGEREADLSPAEAEAFEQLLRTSQPARDALASAEDELAPIADRFDPPMPTAAQWSRVDNAIREETARAGGRSRFRALPVWVAAAAAILIVGIGFAVPLPAPAGGGDGTSYAHAPTLPPPPAPTEPVKPGPKTPAFAGGERNPATEHLAPAIVLGGMGGLEFDPNIFEAGYDETSDASNDHLLCVWVRDKRL